MRRTILAMAAMLAALILGSGVALALGAVPAEGTGGSPTGTNPCDPRVMDLGTLGGADSAAIEVNDSEWVVGWARKRDGTVHPALWRSGNVRDLGTLNFAHGLALGINESGTIVGGLQNVDPIDGNDAPARTRGFVWREGEMKPLPTLGGDSSYARRVNERGVIAGTASLPNGNDRAVIWRHGKPKNLGTLGGNYSYAMGINDRGQVVGGSAKRRNGPPHAFLWKDGRMRDLGTLGGPESQANVIDNRGRIAGISALPGATEEHATVWENGRARGLGTLGGVVSFGLGINDHGQVVGLSDTIKKDPYPNHIRGFVWSGGLMLGLPTLGSDFGNAHGINNEGDIAGQSALPSGKEHATLYRCALGLNPNAYLKGRSTAGTASVESSVLSEGAAPFDRLTPWFSPAKR
jgi:probable HAF family extracellular repeat protein